MRFYYLGNFIFGIFRHLSPFFYVSSGRKRSSTAQSNEIIVLNLGMERHKIPKRDKAGICYSNLLHSFDCVLATTSDSYYQYLAPCGLQYFFFHIIAFSFML